MDYFEWNDLIAGYFFRPEHFGERVYLFVTSDLLSELGRAQNVGHEDFLSTARLGPPGLGGLNVCEKAERLANNWRKRKLIYPPYIAYLALFVFASGIESEFAKHAYYPRLRKLLGEPETNISSYPSFSRMNTLWEDLEYWSQIDKKQKLGIFTMPALSGYVHVGIPISQSFFSQTGLQALHRFFFDAGLDPTAPPSTVLLTNLLLHNGGTTFSQRIMRVLNSPAHYHDEYTALMEVIIQELRNWDGSYTLVEDPHHRIRTIQGTLRLCCEDIDRVAGSMSMRLRLLPSLRLAGAAKPRA
jgi:hypothetical protein